MTKMRWDLARRRDISSMKKDYRIIEGSSPRKKKKVAAVLPIPSPLRLTRGVGVSLIMNGHSVIDASLANPFNLEPDFIADDMPSAIALIDELRREIRAA